MTGLAKAKSTGVGLGGDGSANAHYDMLDSDLGVTVNDNAIVEGKRVTLSEKVTDRVTFR